VKRRLVAIVAPEPRQPLLALARQQRGAHRLADEFAVDREARRRVHAYHALTLVGAHRRRTNFPIELPHLLTDYAIGTAADHQGTKFRRRGQLGKLNTSESVR
jgi:hypothetical protein